MARQIRLLPVTEFQPGLNLRADAFQLQNGESPDLLDVDVDPRGGFTQRGAVAKLHASTIGGVPTRMWQYHTSGGTNQIMVQSGTTFYFSTGGNFTSGSAFASAGVHRAVTFNDLCYIQNGINAPKSWNGAAATALTQTFNDNLASPTSGNMPIAACITAHMGYVWLANTNEGGVAKPNRVRWSHPNSAENWRTNDFIDIDIGHDGDVITALVPHQDRLLVFKNRSVHVITGYDPDSFQVFPLTQTTGAVSQEATISCELGVYWFGWPDGAFFYDGHSTRWLFERLHPAIVDDTIPDAFSGIITVGWMKRRLWVSVPWQGSTVNSRTFVFDPTLGKQGGWVAYGFGLNQMIEYKPISGATQYLGCSPTFQFVLKMEQAADRDDLGNGATNIGSYYRSRWFDAGSPAYQKRWRRPEFVVDGDFASSLRVDFFKDYDPINVSRTFNLAPTQTSTGSSWNGFNWGTGTWGVSNTGAQEILQGSPLGRGRALQFRITGPAPSVRWGVNEVSLKYILRQLR